MSKPVFFASLAALAAASSAMSQPPKAEKAANDAAQQNETATDAQSKPPLSGERDTLARAKPAMDKVLKKLTALGAEPIATLTVEQARTQPSPADAAKAVMEETPAKEPTPKVTRTDLTYPGAAGSLPARVYKPANAAGDAKLPLIVYYHGGGWVIADIDTYDASAAALAAKTPAIVVSVEYRKAPESPLPAAHEDAFAAYQWALENAESWGADPSRVAVAGESAGGNLAANVAIMAREQNIEEPDYMALIYPVAGLDMNTPSYRKNAKAKPLSKDAMQWFAEKAIKGEEAKEVVNLLDADLGGLPSATIVTAEIDPLRSEGQMLAQELEAAGVKTELRDYEGVTHEFFGMASVVPTAAEAQEAVTSDLKAALSANRTASGEEEPRIEEGGDQ